MKQDTLYGVRFSEEKGRHGKGSLHFSGLGRWLTNKPSTKPWCTPRGDIYRYAYWLCRDPQIAEDLVRGDFPARLEGDRYPAGRQGCQGVAHHHCGGRMPAASSETVRSRRPRRAPYGIRVSCQASRRWSTNGSGSVTSRALLPAEYQEPAAAGSGDSAGEIAEQLGLNKNTVMTRLFRAPQPDKRGHGVCETTERTHQWMSLNFAAGPSLTLGQGSPPL